jgi:hypothetical protein
MTLPPITKKQYEILIALYKFRFLTRIHLQAILFHKNHRRIQAWLTDLTKKNYIEKIYSEKFPENMHPAIYYLGKNGRKKFLQQHAPKKQLQNTYRDNNRSEVYRLRCLLLADCLNSIVINVHKQPYRVSNFCMPWEYEYSTDTQAVGFHPDALCLVHNKQTDKEEKYLLYLLHDRSVRHFLGYRLRHIVNYFTQEGYWEKEPPPHILIVTTTKELIIFAQTILRNKWKQNDPDLATELNIRILTTERLFSKGLYSTR